VTTTPPSPPPSDAPYPRPDLGSAAVPGSGLAARATACYQATPPHPAAGEQAWRVRAARAVRILAATLGVDPAHVLAVPDPDRAYGLLAVPEVRLQVSEPRPAAGRRVFEFVPEYASGESFVLLAACPGCARPVPAYRVATLADLGRHLTHPAQAPDADQFTSDPAHAPGCPRHRPDPRYATAHRTPPAPAPAPAPSATTGAVGGGSRVGRAVGPCGCACSTGGWCGGCGHAGCSRR
jgi:hypothetical protein